MAGKLSPGVSQAAIGALSPHAATRSTTLNPLHGQRALSIVYRCGHSSSRTHSTLLEPHCSSIEVPAPSQLTDMKFFGGVFTGLVVISLGILSAAAQSSDTLIAGIQSITTSSSTLQVTVSEINITNIVTTGPVCRFSVHAFGPYLLSTRISLVGSKTLLRRLPTSPTSSPSYVLIIACVRF